MTVSSSATFTLPADEVLDAAMRRIFGDKATGYDARAGRRAMQLLLQKLQLRGVALWTIEQAEPLALMVGQGSYTLAADTVDLLEVALRRDGRDYLLGRISRDVWFAVPDKAAQGRPAQFYLERRRDAPVLFLDPVPEAADQLVYYRVRRFRDVPGLADDVDIPPKWLPAVISGLAYYLALEMPDRVPLDVRADLRGTWEVDYEEAAAEDRDSAVLRIEPDLSAYFG